MNIQTDIVILGAGPAGIATAIAAAQKGLKCVVLDSRVPPIDKPCGEGLLPHGVHALRALGIHLNSDIAVPFTGIRFTDELSTASAQFCGTPGFALRRVRLHELLVERAENVGVTFLWGTRVGDFGSNHVIAGNDCVQYKWLVGADGQNSSVRKWANLDFGHAGRERFGFRRHFRIRPWSSMVEVYWRPGCQLVVTPTGPDEVGVVVVSRDSSFRLRQALPLFTALAEKLQDAEYASTESGGATSLRQYPAVTRGCIALVGDASGSVDAITGHGLSLSFQQAFHLAEAFERGDLAQYDEAHRKIGFLPVVMSRLMLAMDGNAWFQRKTLRLFESSPALFSKLLSIHTGSFPLLSSGADEIIGAERNLLRA